jgi:uncharacterized protein YjbK
MLEKEYKAIIGKEKFSRLQSFFRDQGIKGSKILQANYYYDSPSFELFSRHATLRVRQIDADLQVEYKCKVLVSSGINHSEEMSKKIEAVPQQIDLSILDIDRVNGKYQMLGCLTTLRENFDFNGCLISLDKSIYLGTVDYELEIEYENNFELEKNLLLLNEKTRTSLPGKYSRFLCAYKKMNGIALE